MENKPDVIETQVPVVFPIDIMRDSPIPIPTLNNETIVVAQDVATLKMHEDAIKQIQTVQNTIIKNYANTKSWLKALLEPKIIESELEMLPCQVLAYVETFIKENPHATIYDFRKDLENIKYLTFIAHIKLIKKFRYFGTHLPDISEKRAKEVFYKELHENNSAFATQRDALILIRNKLLVTSVSCITGPGVHMGLFEPPSIEIKKRDYGFITTISIEPAEEYDDFLSRFEKASLEKNNLSGCFFSKNTFEEIKKSKELDAEKIIGTLGDQAWTHIGEKKQRERCNKLVDAGNIIWHGWTHYRESKRKQNEDASQPQPERLIKKPKV